MLEVEHEIDARLALALGAGGAAVRHLERGAGRLQVGRHRQQVALGHGGRQARQINDAQTRAIHRHPRHIGPGIALQLGQSLHQADLGIHPVALGGERVGLGAQQHVLFAAARLNVFLQAALVFTAPVGDRLGAVHPQLRLGHTEIGDDHVAHDPVDRDLGLGLTHGVLRLRQRQRPEARGVIKRLAHGEVHRELGILAGAGGIGRVVGRDHLLLDLVVLQRDLDPRQAQALGLFHGLGRGSEVCLDHPEFDARGDHPVISLSKRHLLCPRGPEERNSGHESQHRGPQRLAPSRAARPRYGVKISPAPNRCPHDVIRLGIHSAPATLLPASRWGVFVLNDL